MTYQQQRVEAIVRQLQKQSLMHESAAAQEAVAAITALIDEARVDELKHVHFDQLQDDAMWDDMFISDRIAQLTKQSGDEAL